MSRHRRRTPHRAIGVGLALGIGLACTQVNVAVAPEIPKVDHLVPSEEPAVNVPYINKRMDPLTMREYQRLMEVKA